MGDTCRDSVTISLLPEEPVRPQTASGCHPLQMFLCASTAQQHGMWGQGHSDSISGWALVCVLGTSASQR